MNSCHNFFFPKEVKKMKPSALIRAIMASVITLALVFITISGRKLVEKEGLVYSGDINTTLVVEDNNKEEMLLLGIIM